MEAKTKTVAATSSISTSTSRWSHLLNELLIKIFTCLQFPDDRARFGRVCRSWCSVRNLYRPPILRLKLDYDTNTISLLYINLDVVGKSKTMVSKLKLCPPVQLFCIIGNWLVLFKDLANIHLANPLSGELICLPPLLGASHFYDVALSTSPASHDCVVICNYEDCETKEIKFACYKMAGDKECWLTLDDMLGHSAKSMAFHKGRLYVLLWDTTVMVYALDNSCPTRLMYSIHQVDQLFQLMCDAHRYRVAFILTQQSPDGDLLLGARVEFVKEWVIENYPEYSMCSPQVERVEYHVFKLEHEKWVRLTSTDLRDRVFLLSSLGMDTVSTEGLVGFSDKGCRVYDIGYQSKFLCVYSFERDGKYLYWKPMFDLKNYAAWFLAQGW